MRADWQRPEPARDEGTRCRDGLCGAYPGFALVYPGFSLDTVSGYRRNTLVINGLRRALSSGDSRSYPETISDSRAKLSFVADRDHAIRRRQSRVRRAVAEVLCRRRGATGVGGGRSSIYWQNRRPNMQLTNKRSPDMQERIIRRRHWLPAFLGFVVLAARAHAASGDPSGAQGVVVDRSFEMARTRSWRFRSSQVSRPVSAMEKGV